MLIKYIPSGDKFKASQLWGEGRHQLSILKNAMGFQKLQQDQRVVRFEDGTIIKCLSCFTQDVVEIFVPLIPGGVAPKYEVEVRSNYWPAFEAYAGPNYDDEFLGVVLCKGGGFNPPYEFVSKDSLPADSSYSQNEELFSERFWELFDGSRINGKYGGTSYQDIVPSGLAKADLLNVSPVIAEETWNGGAGSWLIRTCRELSTMGTPPCDPPADFYWYYARGGRGYAFTRTEHLKETRGFSYRLPGDANPGSWLDYTYEGVPHSAGKKPVRTLNFSENFYYEISGNGSNQFLPFTSGVARAFAMKIVDGNCVVDDTVNFDSVSALVPPDGLGMNFDFPKRYYFCEVTDHSPITRYPILYVEYSWTKDDHSPFEYSCSVMDDDHYALVYSMSLGGSTSFYNKPPIGEALVGCVAYLPCAPELPSCGEVPSTRHASSNRNEGPLCVVVDGVVFELFPQAVPENAPRLQEWKVKYFKVNDELSIGMFCIAKNYTPPYDYMYVYAKVTPDEQELVITPVDAHNHLIPGVTGADEVDLYGHWNFRLILETITTIKKVA